MIHLLAGFVLTQTPTKIGIFDLDAIHSVPLDAKVVRRNTDGNVVTETIRFTSAPGVRVFAYLTYPKGANRLAGNFVIANNGATARKQDARTGFVGFSLCAPAGNTDPDKDETIGGPAFTSQFVDDPNKSWVYHHAVAITRGLDYLATRKEVDVSKVVVMGFSWSGYIGALVHAIDNRPAVYVTWNSTGYYADEQGLSGGRPSTISRKLYEMYSPSAYAQYGTKPIFIGNALTDFFATFDGQMEMYRKLRSPKRFVFAPNRYHADTSREEYASSGPYANEIQLGGPKTPTVREGVATVTNGKLLYKFTTNAGADLIHADVMFSYGGPGHWTGRSWRRVPAKRSGDEFVCEIPVYDPAVPLYAVAQIQTKKFGCSANGPQFVDPKALGITSANATYPNMLFDFEDQSDLYFGSGEPTFVKDAAEGKFAASVEPFEDGTVHLLNVETMFWKNAKELHFYLKGDGKPGPVYLYMTRFSNYFLDKESKLLTQFEVVSPGKVFRTGWHNYSIDISDIDDLPNVDGMFFEVGQRKLLIDGIRLK